MAATNAPAETAASAMPAAGTDRHPPPPHEPPVPAAPPGLIEVQAMLSRIVFPRGGGRSGGGGGWVVARLEASAPLPKPLATPGNGDRMFAAVGTWPDPTEGAEYRCRGTVETSKYGQQMKLSTVPEVVKPDSEDGLVRMLAAERFTHIGPIRARKIVEKFGMGAMAIIEDDPQRLAEISGITPVRAQQIHDDWQAFADGDVLIREVMRALYALGLGRWQVNQIIARHKTKALDVVRGDPYSLIEDIVGFGWANVDQIARRAGVGKSDPRRIEAAVVHLLGALTGDGHTVYPREDLVGRALKGRDRGGLNLDVSADLVHDAINRQLDRGLLTDSPAGDEIEQPIALRRYRKEEHCVAQILLDLSKTEPPKADVEPTAMLPADLTSEQHQAVRWACMFGLSVLTGGPGTGKTFTLKAATDALESMGLSVALAAPTGKAARRMQQATGRLARTVHRLLGFSPADGFAHNATDPLVDDVIILDETSMLDIDLCYALTDALVPGVHRLLLVGDVNQLPSIGAGSVLRDIIASRRVPVTALAKIHRQAEGSSIVIGAHAVNHGEMPPLGTAGDLKTYLYGDEEDSRALADNIVNLVTKVLPAAGLDPIKDVQVLAPMYRGGIGVTSLCSRLQDALNPDRGQPRLTIRDTVIRQGDRVIQVRNDYGLGIYNGETGIAVEVRQKGLTVDFGEPDGDPVLIGYGTKEARNLRLAYALSIHKSQGSEWPCVVVPVHREHTFMWSRQLLYTAMTRARRFCCLFAVEKTLRHAIRQDKPSQRMTALRSLLLQRQKRDDHDHDREQAS